jgi:protein-tyrosine kinase
MPTAAAATLNSSEWMAPQSMNCLLQNIKRDFRNWTVIIDSRPVLMGDDVISILPQIDCILFVAPVGTSTIYEIENSNKRLESTSIVRFVLNKSSDLPGTYYSRYAESQPRRK